VIKSGRIRWAEGACRCGNIKERDHVKTLGVTLEDNIKMGVQEVGWEHGIY
jgi:hypothetical protein